VAEAPAARQRRSSPKEILLERPLLMTDQDMARVNCYRLAGGTSVLCSRRSPDKSSGNEDAAAVIPIDAQRAVLAVADGLGGQPAGQQASRLALKVLRAALILARRQNTLLRTAIMDGLESANRKLLEQGVGAGTTVAVVEIDNGRARTYHVGDSAILVVGQRGRRKLLTTSHSPVGYAQEAGLLDEEEALEHRDRHIVSNILGAPEMSIQVGSSQALARRDTLLLASDGLFDNLRVEEITDLIRKGPLTSAIERLVTMVTERMTAPNPDQPCKPDDLTVLAWRPAAKPKTLP
jgi:serine/threonine protein phosphatase PrpC